jgi:regulator of sirC expression with transglutaminase-like and TPR domain
VNGGDHSVNETILYLGLIDDDQIALDEAALALAALDHPRIDIARYRVLLAEMAEQLNLHRDAARGVYDRAVLLAAVLAGQYDLRGDSENYDDPANADLIAVLDRRRGLPIALSILYVALARRIGWSAVGLNTPGHVLVLIGQAPASVVIDPFNAGAVVNRDEFAKLQSRGGASDGSLGGVAALSNRAMLVRLVLNQATRARAAGQYERALVLYQRMTTVAPLLSHLWWDRAELERQLGQIVAARASLNAMLETTRDTALRKHIRAALDNLARSIH